MLHPCKPDFVPRGFPRSDGHSSDAGLATGDSGFRQMRLTRDYPPGSCEPGGSGRRPVFPVCLAPRGVCRAPGLAARGGGLLPRLFTLTGDGAALHGQLRGARRRLRRFVFCDTFRQARLATHLPAFVMRRAALWCPDFPPANLAVPRRPPRMQRREADRCRNGRKVECGQRSAPRQGMEARED